MKIIRAIKISKNKDFIAMINYTDLKIKKKINLDYLLDHIGSKYLITNIGIIIEVPNNPSLDIFPRRFTKIIDYGIIDNKSIKKILKYILQ